MDVIDNIMKMINNNNNNKDKETTFLLALTMYINFYYEDIVSQPTMLNYLVDSKNQINKLALTQPSYTRRQIESIYIAFSIIVILFLFNSTS